MKRNQFSFMLRSSMHVYPDNMTSHFSTYLPQQVDLDGQWSVVLAEIHMSMSMHHVKGDWIDRKITTQLLHFTEKEKKILRSGVVTVETKDPHQILNKNII